MDEAHKLTDEQLHSLEADIKQTYKEAYNEMRKKQRKYLEKNAKEYIDMQEKLAKGLITRKEYRDFVISSTSRAKWYRDMCESLAADLTRTDQIAAEVINTYLPDMYALNYNYGTYEAEIGSGIDTNFVLYDKATVERLLAENADILKLAGVDTSKAIAWNNQKITSAILQSLLLGESIPNAAKRLQTVVEMETSSAIRNARTYTTGAENAGRIDSYKRAQGMGIKLKKQWLSTIDGRTRHSHRQLDGVSVPVDDSFLEDNTLRFPGDPQGPAEEIYNCRCTLVADIEVLDQSDAPRMYKSDMPYDEWKNAKPVYGKKGGKNGKKR